MLDQILTKIGDEYGKIDDLFTNAPEWLRSILGHSILDMADHRGSFGIYLNKDCRPADENNLRTTKEGRKDTPTSEIMVLKPILQAARQVPSVKVDIEFSKRGSLKLVGPMPRVDGFYNF